MRETPAGGPDVSVILCFRDAMHVLERQLEALAAQEPLDAFELLLIDNCSQDASRKIASEWCSSFPHARVIDAADHANQYSATNAAVALAGRSLLIFVDADDEVQEGYVAALTAALQSYPIVCGHMDRNKLNPAWLRDSRGEDPPEGPLLWMDNVSFLPFAPGASLGIQRRVFDAVGGFDPNLTTLSDTDLCWKVQIETGSQLFFVPDAVVAYRYRNGLGQLFKQERAYARCEVALYRRYRPRGLRQLSLRENLYPWKRLVRLAPGAISRAGRARAAVAAGHRMGRIEGSIHHRTFLI
jgi:glycosyltransferase involved in cell wall biosynthesis